MSLIEQQKEQKTCFCIKKKPDKDPRIKREKIKKEEKDKENKQETKINTPEQHERAMKHWAFLRDQILNMKNDANFLVRYLDQKN